ncbi:MAG: FtsX-like permease family protein [Candidatus Latescibacterota bacterium]
MDIDDDFVPGEDHWQAANGFAYRHICLLLGEDRKPEGLAQRALDLVEAHVGSERRTLFEQGYMAAAVTLFVLLIACVNYTNLATALSARRAREVGVRKALGAGRGQLIAQFLGESLLLALLALTLALCLSALLLPAFARFSTADLSLSQLVDPTLLLVLLVSAVCIGLLAGIYPAFFLSGSSAGTRHLHAPGPSGVPVRPLHRHDRRHGHRLRTVAVRAGSAVGI